MSKSLCSKFQASQGLKYKTNKTNQENFKNYVKVNGDPRTMGEHSLAYSFSVAISQSSTVLFIYDSFLKSNGSQSMGHYSFWGVE